MGWGQGCWDSNRGSVRQGPSVRPSVPPSLYVQCHKTRRRYTTHHARHLKDVLVAHPVVVRVRVPGHGRARRVRLHDPDLVG